jgi:hypothetical protein
MTEEIASPIPIEMTLDPPIQTNGLEDTYEDFDDIITEEVRERVAAAGRALLHVAAPELDLNDVLISCFGQEYGADAMDGADMFKLGVASHVPLGGFLDAEEHHDFGGDDSNEANIIERQIQLLRDSRAGIGLDINRLMRTGRLNESERLEAAQRVAEINAQIEALNADKAKAVLPVYFATPFDGLLQSVAEDNPLAYAGEVPGEAYLAFYNGAAMRAAGLKLTNKTDEQIRIAARGAEIMRHCVAVMKVVFVDTAAVEDNA